MRIQIDNLLANVTLMFMVDALANLPSYCTCNSGAPVLAHFHIDAYSHGHSDACCFLLAHYFRLAFLPDRRQICFLPRLPKLLLFFYFMFFFA